MITMVQTKDQKNNLGEIPTQLPLNTMDLTQQIGLPISTDLDLTQIEIRLKSGRDSMNTGILGQLIGHEKG